MSLEKSLEKKLDAELRRPSYSPDDIPKTALSKAILALSDSEKMKVVVSLCERIASLRENGAQAWHAHEYVVVAFGRKVLPWSLDDASAIVAIAVALGDDYYYLPMQKIVPMLEGLEASISPALRKSIRALAKRMRAAESVPHQKLAKRLRAL